METFPVSQLREMLLQQLNLALPCHAHLHTFMQDENYWEIRKPNGEILTIITFIGSRILFEEKNLELSTESSVGYVLNQITHIIK